MDISNPLTAYQLDKAVTHFGGIIENALHERKQVQVGKHKESRPVYNLEQLLEDDFRLPRPLTKGQKRRQGAMSLLALAGDPRSGVKMWVQKAPEAESQHAH